jgi:hypothetical protein
MGNLDTRIAPAGDGATPQQVMAASAQPLGDIVLTVVSMPDFFGRASAYEAATVFVAEVDGAVSGSAAVAVSLVGCGNGSRGGCAATAPR